MNSQERRLKSSRALILAPASLFGEAPPVVVAAAAAAGFDAVGLRLSPVRPGEVQQPMLGDTPMMRETLTLMADTGVKAFDMETLMLRPDTVMANYKPLMDAGARLGIKHILTAVADCEESRAVDLVGEACDQADAFGQCIDVEFMPWLAVSSLHQANALVQKVGRPNVRILLDSLHLDRSGGTVSDIAKIDQKYLAYAQVCDASAERPATLQEKHEEAKFHRRLIGEGALPLRDFVRSLPSDLPLSFEVPLHAFKDLNATQKAQLAMKNLRTLL